MNEFPDKNRRSPDTPEADAVLEAAKRIVSGEAKRVDHMREVIMSQMPAAYAAYHTIAGVLDREDVRVASKEQAYAELANWFTGDKLEYVRAAHEADPSLEFNLVAVPNVLVDHNELTNLAADFAERMHDDQLQVFDDLYDKYTPEQLSGTDPQNGNDVSFMLIPSKRDERFLGTPDGQRRALSDLKQEYGFLGVPSPLHAVGLWHSARNRSLSEHNAFLGENVSEATYITHFDLPEQAVGGAIQFVPKTVVGTHGSVLLHGSIATSPEAPQQRAYQGRVGIV